MKSATLFSELSTVVELENTAAVSNTLTVQLNVPVAVSPPKEFSAAYAEILAVFVRVRVTEKTLDAACFLAPFLNCICTPVWANEN